MSCVTNATDWLSGSITSQAKSLIAAFYELVDSKAEDSGNRLATEIFSNEAIFISPSGTFSGNAEISKCREGAWSLVTLRRHSISKAFASIESKDTISRTELVLLGSVYMNFVNGKSLNSPFAAHIIIGSSTLALAEPRIEFMEVFSLWLDDNENDDPSFPGRRALEEIDNSKRPPDDLVIREVIRETATSPATAEAAATPSITGSSPEASIQVPASLSYALELAAEISDAVGSIITPAPRRYPAM
ncbi:hypothetical protein CFIO01_09514 [Colletotrichum fioriniae PJ7]|uniref:SnoaL-like domain-containing protein n=1 Tax=Colletotrichum fioriniae PJ7 TaxID=1445577 RepID=A0A010QGN7_9PEZI|nr:hypothetical protein CFIO01_09514 [Colletotrichum fioriniae PJ7]